MRLCIALPVLLAVSLASPLAFAEESVAVPVPEASSSTVSSELSLKLAIGKSYETVGTLSWTTEREVSLYEITVRAPEKEPYTFTLDGSKTAFSDWHAKPGKTLYTVRATLEDGKSVSAEQAIYMGYNGEPTTPAALESARKAKEEWQKSSEKQTSDAAKPAKEDKSSEKPKSGEKSEEKKEEKKPEQQTEKSDSKQAGVSTTVAKAKLSAETRAALEERFDAIPQEERELYFMKLIGRIDMAIAKSLAKKQPKTVALLREIRAIAEERLNAMDTPDEEGLVQDLLREEE